MINLQTHMPRVAIFLVAANKTDRDLLRGILRFVHLHSPWAAHIEDGRSGEYHLQSLAAWGCTGIIISDLCVTPAITAFIRAKHPAVITLGECLKSARVAGRINCANAPLAKLAARHLRQAGYTHFAFVGEIISRAWSVERGAIFSQELAAAGFSCERFKNPTPSRRQDAAFGQRELGRWLRALPKPVAIFASTDFRARQVLDACLLEKLSVPNEVAILGVDNDETLCETALPSISSIPMNTEEVGFAAGSLLDNAMRQREKSTPPVPLLYTGREVVIRQSTQPHHINDPLAQRCLELIELNLSSRLRVNDLAHGLGLSRRSLEMRMREATGQTIAAQIYALRLKRAAALLKETSMSINAIADLCGFANDSHLSLHFLNAFHLRPYAYRQQAIRK